MQGVSREREVEGEAGGVPLTGTIVASLPSFEGGGNGSTGLPCYYFLKILLCYSFV